MGGGPGEQPLPLLWLEPALCSWALAESPQRWVLAKKASPGVLERSAQGTTPVVPAVMVVFLGRHLPALLGLFKKKGEWVWLGGLDERFPNTPICQALL